MAEWHLTLPPSALQAVVGQDAGRAFNQPGPGLAAADRPVPGGYAVVRPRPRARPPSACPYGLGLGLQPIAGDQRGGLCGLLFQQYTCEPSSAPSPSSLPALVPSLWRSAHGMASPIAAAPDRPCPCCPRADASALIRGRGLRALHPAVPAPRVGLVQLPPLRDRRFGGGCVQVTVLFLVCWAAVAGLAHCVASAGERGFAASAASHLHGPGPLEPLENQVGQEIHPLDGDGLGQFIGAGEVLLEQLALQPGRKGGVGGGDVLFLADPEAEVVQVG